MVMATNNDHFAPFVLPAIFQVLTHCEYMDLWTYDYDMDPWLWLWLWIDNRESIKLGIYIHGYLAVDV